jgi:hypothetical protein
MLPVLTLSMVRNLRAAVATYTGARTCAIIGVSGTTEMFSLHI